MHNFKVTHRQKKSDKANIIALPTQVPLIQKCHKIVAGSLHSYAISNNSVYLWGKKMTYSMKGQTKSQVSAAYEEDRIVQLPIKVDNLATGPKHTFAWNQKQVYCWGSNENYQLGLEEQQEYECQKVGLFEQAMKNGYHLQQIQCGQSHTLAIFRVAQFERQQELFPSSLSEITQKQQDNEEEGIQMFAWGKSQSYQLTINSVSIIPYPVLTPCSFKHLTSVRSKSDYNVALCNGKVYTWGANLFTRLGNIQSKVRIPQQVALPTKIAKIGVGNHHAVAVAVNGTAYAWGKGDLGQLGIDRFQTESRPTKMMCSDRIVDVACGDLHTLVKLQTNQLKTCGGNKNGALGHNIFDASDKKKRCKKLQLVQDQQTMGMISMIACGNHHNLVLNDDGVLFGWGNNGHFQIIPSLQKKQPKQLLVRHPKKPLEIIIDEQVIKNGKGQEQLHQSSIDSYLQKMSNWKYRYDLFRQQKAKQEQMLMKEYEQIVASIKNAKKL